MSICEGSQKLIKPQQLLDGLVDLGEANRLTLIYGLALTCAITESVMQRYDTGQAECLELPFDDLHLFCGCQNTMDEEENNECTFFLGAKLFHHNRASVETNEDKVSCEKAKTLAAQTEREAQRYAAKSKELVQYVAAWSPRTHVSFAKLEVI